MSRKGRLGRRPFLFQLIRHVIDPIHSMGNRRPECYLRTRCILRSRVSATGSLVRVSGTRYRFRPFWMSLTFALLHAATPHLHLCTLLPAPVPAPDDPYLIPDQLRPETRRFATALKGKPETGLYAAVIGPQLIIRSPSAAPFERMHLSLVHLSTCQPAS
jgi:hypothetical protein